MSASSLKSNQIKQVAAIADGYYTVVYNETTWRTFRVETAAWAGNRQVIGMLIGQDNEGDYLNFGFLNAAGHVSVWRKFEAKRAENWRKAVAVIASNGERAGMAYAIKAGRCRRCARLLTVEASVNQGYGPTCLGKVEAMAL